MAIGYRHTKTYIAASFDHDRDAVEKLYEWNKDNELSFHFVDVHSLTQSYDTSRYCSIKKSLSERMSVSKTFILIVGQHTNEVTKGACYNNGCGGYVRLLLSNPYCKYGYSINNKSYNANWLSVKMPRLLFYTIQLTWIEIVALKLLDTKEPILQ